MIHYSWLGKDFKDIIQRCIALSTKYVLGHDYHHSTVRNIIWEMSSGVEDMVNIKINNMIHDEILNIFSPRKAE